MEKNLGNLENEILLVNGVPYRTIKLLGKGKGGYSYLAEKADDLSPATEADGISRSIELSTMAKTYGAPIGKDICSIAEIDGESCAPEHCSTAPSEGISDREKHDFVVLKQIHHEPCDYYTFGNKIEAEKHDYTRLISAGIRIPRLFDIDEQNERIVKEFIDGKTVAEMVAEGTLPPEIMEQGKKMATLAKAAGLNIDYYPTNFVVDKSGALYYVDYECNTYTEEWSFDSWGVKYWLKFP